MLDTTTTRPEFFTLENGAKATLPFTPQEYAARLQKLRAVMAARDITW